MTMEILQAKNEWHKWVNKDNHSAHLTKKYRDYKKDKILQSMKECSFSPKLNRNKINEMSKFKVYQNSRRLYNEGVTSAEKKYHLEKEFTADWFTPKINRVKGVTPRSVQKNKSKAPLKNKKQRLNKSKSEVIFKENFSHLTMDLEIDVKNPDDSSLINSRAMTSAIFETSIQSQILFIKF